MPTFSMRELLVVGALAGCSGTSNTDFGTNPTPNPDGGGPAPDGGTSSSTLYGQCGLPKPLTAGSYTEPRANVTLRWPAPWTGVPVASNSYATSEPYTYLPTNATTTRQTTTAVEFYDDEVATDAADAAKRLSEATAGVPDAQVRRFTINGHSAVMWWTQEAPPQPGCMGCQGDPGPDIVTISLNVEVNLRIVKLTAEARVNAPADVFCDIQAIELGLTAP
jgi:hypothetical protein